MSKTILAQSDLNDAIDDVESDVTTLEESNHSHDNKTTLDNIEEALTTDLKDYYDNSAQLDDDGTLVASQVPDWLVNGLEWGGVLSLVESTENDFTYNSTVGQITAASAFEVDGSNLFLGDGTSVYIYNSSLELQYTFDVSTYVTDITGFEIYGIYLYILDGTSIHAYDYGSADQMEYSSTIELDVSSISDYIFTGVATNGTYWYLADTGNNFIKFYDFDGSYQGNFFDVSSNLDSEYTQSLDLYGDYLYFGGEDSADSIFYVNTTDVTDYYQSTLDVTDVGSIVGIAIYDDSTAYVVDSTEYIYLLDYAEVSVEADALETDLAEEDSGLFHKVSIGSESSPYTSSITGEELEYANGDWLIYTWDSDDESGEWEHVPTSIDTATTTSSGTIIISGDIDGSYNDLEVVGLYGVKLDGSCSDVEDEQVLQYSETEGGYTPIFISKIHDEDVDYSAYVDVDAFYISDSSVVRMQVDSTEILFQSVTGEFQLKLDDDDGLQQSSDYGVSWDDVGVTANAVYTSTVYSWPSLNDAKYISGDYIINKSGIKFGPYVYGSSTDSEAWPYYGFVRGAHTWENDTDFDLSEDPTVPTVPTDDDALFIQDLMFIEGDVLWYENSNNKAKAVRVESVDHDEGTITLGDFYNPNPTVTHDSDETTQAVADDTTYSAGDYLINANAVLYGPYVEYQTEDTSSWPTKASLRDNIGVIVDTGSVDAGTNWSIVVENGILKLENLDES